MRKVAIVVLFLSLLATASYLYVSKRSPQKTSQTQMHQTTQSPDQTITPTPQPTSFNKQKYSLDDPTSIWLIVNKTRPFNPKSYAPNDLVSVGGSQYLRAEAASQFIQLQKAAAAQSLNILPLSGYRSYSTQVAVYSNEVKNYGQTVADTQSARPGTSEHQSGWSIDVGGGGCGIEDCFGNTKEGQWLAAHGHEYGFIIRYPQGKQAVTGYRAEPWHIRYVGVELATEMRNQSILTLEEFFNTGPAPDYL